MRFRKWPIGRSTSSGAAIRPRASKCCPDAGVSGAPSDGSGVLAASPRTVKPTSKAPSPRSSSPISRHAKTSRPFKDTYGGNLWPRVLRFSDGRAQPIVNIPAAEAEEHVYAMLDDTPMAVRSDETGLQQSRGGSIRCEGPVLKTSQTKRRLRVDANWTSYWIVSQPVV